MGFWTTAGHLSEIVSKFCNTMKILSSTPVHSPRSTEPVGAPVLKNIELNDSLELGCSPLHFLFFEQPNLEVKDLVLGVPLAYDPILPTRGPKCDEREYVSMDFWKCGVPKT
jgi:hypothetical protein